MAVQSSAPSPAHRADSEPFRTPPAPAPAGTPTPASARARVACFSIHAEAEPEVMPRVLELFAKRGLVPRRWVSGVTGPGGGLGTGPETGSRGRELTIDVQVAGLAPETQAYIANCLRQIWGIDAVLTSERGRGERGETPLP